MSFLAWLDYSEEQRRKTLDVIDLFREEEKRDELGLGSVRDAYADLLFPGTSTIQTRAKYFLLIPWLYLRLERRKTPSAEIARTARSDEIRLIDTLADSEDNDGVIGIEARKTLKRLPSSVYWQGLQAWGIRTFHGSLGQYHRYLDVFYRLRGDTQVDDDGEPVGGPLPANWHKGLPKRPRDFPGAASLRLTRAEADYLRERILASVPGTLIAHLVAGEIHSDPVAFPWEHPAYGEFPADIQEELSHARNFSETLHGAALLYNLMLSEKANHEERIEKYTAAFRDWHACVAERLEPLRTWDHARFWQLARKGGLRITLRTQAFVEAWIRIALEDSPVHILEVSQDARRLIRDRERALKGGQARLENRRALELWGGASGASQLDFRWPISRTIVNDIVLGLRSEAGHA